MKKLLISVIFIVCCFFTSIAQNKQTKELNTYEGYVEVIQTDSSIIVTPIYDEHFLLIQEDTLWEQTLKSKNFKTLLEVFSWLACFDYFPETIKFDEFDESIYIRLHRKIQDMWSVTNKFN